MEYPQSFKSLINKLTRNQKVNTDENLNHIGFGNPAADILIIGKEAAIKKDKKEQIKLEDKSNLEQWDKNIKYNFQLEALNRGEFNPLFPYKGQLNKRDSEKKPNGGTSATWWWYQKLIDAIIGNDIQTKEDNEIDFFRNAFITEFSTKTAKNSPPKNSETQASIDTRCSELLNDDFFKSFKVVIAACGPYIYMYDINVKDVFNQTLVAQGKRKGIYNIYKSENGRVLIHTYQLSRISNDLIQDIAKEIREFLGK